MGALFLCLILPATLPAQSHHIPSAAPGLQESGAPAFTVLDLITLGLDAPPTDLQLMPDGRLVLVAGRQIAFGDGARWQIFNLRAGEPQPVTTQVGVDADGTIYQAVPGGFAQTVFDSDGTWRLEQVADWPADETRERPVPTTVNLAGGEWFWHSSSGPVTSWRPGAPVRSFGLADAVGHIFRRGSQLYLSEWHVGTLTQIKAGDTPATPRPVVASNIFVTCSLPWTRDRVMLGTNSQGLLVFDQDGMHPFKPGGLLAGGPRINSLCTTAGGHFAAAVENLGVVFFDADGRVVQILGRSLDHRLNRVLRLVPGANNQIWGLLDGGVLRVDFPQGVSYFESVLSDGFETIHPSRVDGQLWMNSDLRILRARYSAEGNLTDFVADMPEGRSIAGLSCAMGFPVTGSDLGAFYRTPGGWRPFAPASRRLRIARPDPVNGEWLYAAAGEVGWLRPEAGGIAVRSFPAPGITQAYNCMTDADGFTWMEMGTGRVARLRPTGPAGAPPEVVVFDSSRGMPGGWAQVFIVDGKVRFNVSDRILRVSDDGRSVVPDVAFQQAVAGRSVVYGRPGRDARGRLWVTTTTGIRVYAGPLDALQPVPVSVPAGVLPYYFTFEDNGVVWMHSYRHLTRYDPALATAPPSPPRAIITHVRLPGPGRVLFPDHGAIPSLPFAQNSLIPYFLAAGGASSATTFEVRLEGGAQDWVAVGSAGSTVFNQLHEGRYQLQVRARTGELVGPVATLDFQIAPPWHRTPVAYALGFCSLLLCGLIAARGILFLQRREKDRLERLVAQRTRELHETNTRLAYQMEEVRTLSQAIEQSPVGVVITDPAGGIIFANPPVCRLSGYTLAELTGRSVRTLRQPVAGDAALAELEAALRSGRSWDGQLVNQAKDGRPIQVHVTASPLRNTAGAIQHHLYLEEDVTEWLAAQERRRRLEIQLFQTQKRESLGTLAGGIAHDFNNILTGILGYCELARLTLGDDSAIEQELAAISAAGRRAKDLVSQILSFTRPGNALLAPLDLSRPVAEALKLFRASTPANIELVQAISPGTALADASQIHQVVLNLCTNAAHAMHHKPGRIAVGLQPATLDAAQAADFGGLPPGDYLVLRVVDNGAGMEPAVLDRVFDPFFTTKQPGEGTGLGLPIVQGIVTAHRGGLRVRSTPGVGTTFEIALPACDGARPASNPPMALPPGDDQEILIVDDEPMVTDFVAVRLRKLGYRPHVLHDPRAALSAVTLAPRRFSALITDLTMPHLSGVELIQQLQKLGVILPTLIVTGYNRNSGRADLASVPDIPVLQKPFTGEELAQALHRLLQNARRG